LVLVAGAGLLVARSGGSQDGKRDVSAAAEGDGSTDEAGTVAESTTASEAPEVVPVPCETPTVHRGGPVDDLGSYSTPEEALEAFIVAVETDDTGEAEQPAITANGYTEITLPDGSIAYADVQGESVPAVIHATSVDDGWTIDNWEASGC
jgi:hypothetical protein